MLSVLLATCWYMYPQQVSSDKDSKYNSKLDIKLKIVCKERFLYLFEVLILYRMVSIAKSNYKLTKKT